MSFCAFAQHVTPFIFCSAWDKTRVTWDNSRKPTQKMWTLDSPLFFTPKLLIALPTSVTHHIFKRWDLFWNNSMYELFESVRYKTLIKKIFPLIILYLWGLFWWWKTKTISLNFLLQFLQNYIILAFCIYRLYFLGRTWVCPLTEFKKNYIYRTRAIITRSWLETALEY